MFPEILQKSSYTFWGFYLNDNQYMLNPVTDQLKTISDNWLSPFDSSISLLIMSPFTILQCMSIGETSSQITCRRRFGFRKKQNYMEVNR